MPRHEMDPQGSATAVIKTTRTNFYSMASHFRDGTGPEHSRITSITALGKTVMTAVDIPPPFYEKYPDQIEVDAPTSVLERLLPIFDREKDHVLTTYDPVAVVNDTAYNCARAGAEL